MKTKTQYTILVIFALCLAFSSCKKNDTVADTKKVSIIGKWNMVRYYDKNDPSDSEPFRAGSYMLFSESSIYFNFAQDNDPFETFIAPYVRDGNKLRLYNGYFEIVKATPTQLILDEYEDSDYESTIELSK